MESWFYLLVSLEVSQKMDDVASNRNTNRWKSKRAESSKHQRYSSNARAASCSPQHADSPLTALRSHTSTELYATQRAGSVRVTANKNQSVAW